MKFPIMRQLTIFFKTEVLLVIAAFTMSLSAGISFLFLDSQFSPLLILGLLFAFVSVLIFIRKPVILVYTALLVVFLPIGLFPANIQSILNRSLTVAALGIMGLQVISQRRSIIWTKSALLMLAFLGWCLMTVLWSQNLGASKNILGGYVLRFVLFFLLLANEINTRESLHGLMLTLACAGWIYIIAGVFTVLSHGYEAGTRLQILESNENTLGTIFPVVAFGMIWLASCANNTRRMAWTFLSIVFIFMSLGLIGLSGSRGGAISWAIMILALLSWQETRLWGIVGVLALLSAIILSPQVLSTTVERFIDRTDGTLLGGREAIWKAAWLLIRDHPFFGVGVGNAPYTMITYIKTFRSIGSNDWVSIHNPILTILAETGIPGALLYLGIIFTAIGSSIRRYFTVKELGEQAERIYLALTFSAFLGYMASWIKGGGMETSFSFFLMIALLLLPSHLESNAFVSSRFLKADHQLD